MTHLPPKKICVVMGGPSAEHEVSLTTGREVMRHIDRSRYAIRAVVINHAGEFFYCDLTTDTPQPQDLASPEKAIGFSGPLKAADTQPVWQDAHCAFLALHGSFGEDGTVQGFLQTIGIPYTGSGVYASAVGMNKVASKQIFEARGLKTPPWTLYGLNHPAVTIDSVIRDRGFPCFVKCPQSGSSRLMGRAANRDELATLLSEYKSHSADIIIESAIIGDEFSCPVLDYPDGSTRVLPPILIRPVSSVYFDYMAKYTDGCSEEIVPAPISPELTRRIQDIALAAHTMLGCRGLTRTDIIHNNDTLYVLEINTLPGLTAQSLAPKAFAAAGGSYRELIDILIHTATVRT